MIIGSICSTKDIFYFVSIIKLFLFQHTSLTHFLILLSTPQAEPGGGSESGCMTLG